MDSMINVNDNWIKLINGNCYWNNELHNMQPIKEKLLRLSCKWTDDYASDILIFFEYLPQYLLEEKITEIDIYFRNFGVNWVLKNQNGEIRKSGEKLNKYIGCAKLVYDGKDITLYWQAGNIY